MNLHIKKWPVLIGIVLIPTGGCENMNDKHKSWLQEGEIIYIGKVDSLKAFSGDERVLFRYWISDPRVKTLTVSWDLGKESLEINVPEHAPAQPFEIYIGKNKKNISEGSHTFQWISRDNHGNRSVVFENGANVYGQRYRERLSNRPLISAEAIGNDVTLTWGGITDEEEIGLLVNYTTTANENAVKSCTSAEASSVVITGVKLTAPITYRTLYLPEPTAIDTFSTAPLKVSVQSTINVALNKPVTHSDADPAANTGQMAVDGITSGNATRWVSDNSNGEHWIEIDLQASFSINAFRMWRDLSNAVQRMKQFRLQAWTDDGAWTDIVAEDNNEVAIYYKEFESITTDRVRLYIPPYTDNRTRVFEIEIYSIVRF
jgi:hypothetical protein